MSGRAKNPFFDDDEEDDGFGGGGAGGYGSQGFGNSGADSWQNSTQAQIQASRERQMASSKNAMRSMYESERIGVATAEELLDQGERLQRTEKKLDDIGVMQTGAQKNINNLKSVFGGFKNWWNKGKDSTTAPVNEAAAGPYHGSERLRDATAYSSTAQTKVDARGFYEEDHYGGQQQGQKTRSAADTEYEKQFQSNVSEMSDGMSRLKQLALGLGDEIESQNQDLDRIADKTDRVNSRMEDQNKQMKHILYGGKKK